MTAAHPYKLVIFDFDGTLSDSGEWFISIVDDLADRFRFRRVDRDEIETLRRRPTREVIQHLGIPGWKLPMIARHVRARFRDSAAQIRTFDGVRAMLHTLTEAGIRMMLCSSNGEANVRAVLGADAARFEAYFCGSGLFGKVAKFRRAIKASGLTPPAILSIGDETRDIDAARAVGIGAGAVLWGYANPETLVAMGPDKAFATPDEIVAYLT
ncbi:HAD family hydrolase [Sphingomonas panacisoli]|uniref:HAD family hydrolase n=1 Tax=Sphingomonas panacisoli TaxID=1813879 RepID=A0A5B8LL45_9SPHN|nr:HAD hydrolase-like protein [Sphingomonas panacisoli]QDZ08465.1 HAD family hydrolase [Sphingomonas panacisoli]